MTAAQNNYSITHYGVKEGLSHQEARVIFEDSRGFIWIGTAFGLTNEVTSMRVRPDALSASMNADLASVVTTPGSFCSPSRGPTSTMVTWEGRGIPG